MTLQWKAHNQKSRNHFECHILAKRGKLKDQTPFYVIKLCLITKIFMKYTSPWDLSNE